MRQKNQKNDAIPHGAEKATGTDRLWAEKPHVIKSFLDVRPVYEQLCTEVEYILRKRVGERAVQTSFIGSRAKTLNSFLEKLTRKHYKKPFNEVTDFAGARVVCLYNNDINAIAEIIHDEFEVIEEVNKLEELEENKFGYIGRHFIVKLGKKSSGARYDDLRSLNCEIQVRTVVQDAWAIIQHHMAYKNESDVPSTLIRKLNSLAGLFETVDDQFELIRSQRDTYVKEIRESKGVADKFLENELNLDTLVEYLKWKYKDRDLASFEGQPSLLLEILMGRNISTLREIENLLDRSEPNGEKAIQAITSLADEEWNYENLPAALAIAISLSILPEFRHAFKWSEIWDTIIAKYAEELT